MDNPHTLFLVVMLFIGILLVFRGLKALFQNDKQYKATNESRLRSNAKFEGAKEKKMWRNL
jgi:predicted tellurium resistance membrane protein TerC